MNKKEFIKLLSEEESIPYPDAEATVELLSMDGKFKEAVSKYCEDRVNFYNWANKALLLIHLKLN